MELKTQCRERFKPAMDAIKEILKKEENTDSPILVAIDGRCGSGKTGIARDRLNSCDKLTVEAGAADQTD